MLVVLGLSLISSALCISDLMIYYPFSNIKTVPIPNQLPADPSVYSAALYDSTGNSGLVNQGFEFKSGGYLKVDNVVVPAAFTISLYLLRDWREEDQTLIYFAGSPSPLHIYRTYSEELAVSIGGTTPIQAGKFKKGKEQAGQWTLIIFSADASGIALVIDQSYVFSSTTTVSSPNTYTVLIGADGGFRQFLGIMHEFRLYSAKKVVSDFYNSLYATGYPPGLCYSDEGTCLASGMSLSTKSGSLEFGVALSKGHLVCNQELYTDANCHKCDANTEVISNVCVCIKDFVKTTSGDLIGCTGKT
jgi:hypothetical protein